MYVCVRVLNVPMYETVSNGNHLSTRVLYTLVQTNQTGLLVGGGVEYGHLSVSQL